MIKVNKTDVIPGRLVKEGLEEKVKDMLDFVCDSKPYTNTEIGSVKKAFKNVIYGHVTVKDQLKLEQYNKCCYCESKFTTNSPGDVEHFRPKGRYKIPGVSGYKKPGYYWLAYDWNNLFFSCEVCNREYKKENFPLFEDCDRAIPHLKNHLIRSEKPILICPNENPSNHLEFQEDTIIAKDIRGKMSIKYYGLKRKGLLDDRLSSFNSLKSIGPLKGDLNRVTQDIVDLINDGLNESYTVDSLKEIFQLNNDFITDSISDSGEFSLMARTSFSI
ncbi:hypothetical protein [Cellulophaga sp. L1A9]|uniref:hypothetical protein n=1 Tax=Cellulophaga sp. L1A9 TaxID=2686362 RepID=UPI00131D8E81|nr:hypothetical protein [Cellulophaga sp. L1A9]